MRPWPSPASMAVGDDDAHRLADLHANREALEASLQAAGAQPAASVMCTRRPSRCGADPAWVVDARPCRRRRAGRARQPRCGGGVWLPAACTSRRAAIDWTRAQLDDGQRLPARCRCRSRKTIACTCTPMPGSRAAGATSARAGRAPQHRRDTATTDVLGVHEQACVSISTVVGAALEFRSGWRRHPVADDAALAGGGGRMRATCATAIRRGPCVVDTERGQLHLPATHERAAARSRCGPPKRSRND